MKFFKENPKVTWLILIALFFLPSVLRFFIFSDIFLLNFSSFVFPYYLALLVIAGLFLGSLASDKPNVGKSGQFSFMNVVIGVVCVFISLLIGFSIFMFLIGT